MLLKYFWLLSLVFAISTSALLSSSSSSHHTSTTKKSTSSSLHTLHSTSTTKKTASSTKSSSHLGTTTKLSATSTHSTKTSTASSAPTLSTFYLVAEDTSLTAYNGVYLHEDPNADYPGYPFMYLDPANKNTLGAATFNLLPNATLQYNGPSGPQFASVSYGHPQIQSVTFGYADQIDQFGLVILTCMIAAGAVTCASAQTGANTFTFYEVNGSSAALEIYDEVDVYPVTLKVVLI